ncbi:hypothetical protein [Dipodfec virus UOA04_Rod_771]|nr:hypothetical protein [Dipodfec virus UOA04_Rod_771]
MSKSSKRLIFSVYSHELEDYPYYPFVAKDLNDGIKKFVRFCRDRSTICEGAELHWIGTCESFWDKNPDSRYPVLENIQPLMFPQRIELKKNWLGHITSRCFILGVLFRDRVVSYISEYLQKKGK